MPVLVEKAALIEALKDKKEDVRMMAAEALGLKGPKSAVAGSVVEALIPALKDKNKDVRLLAEGALKRPNEITSDKQPAWLMSIAPGEVGALTPATPPL